MTSALIIRYHLRLLLPLIVWMCLIAFLSSDFGSTEHMLTLMPPFLRNWLAANYIDTGPLPEGLWGIRKLAHVTVYAGLGILTYRWLRTWITASRRLWFLTLIICFLYASLDEIHQSFVPSRTASPFDVLFDLIGVCVGVIFFCKYRQRKLLEEME